MEGARFRLWRLRMGVASLCGWLSVLPGCAAEPPDPRPNVILILADDLGYGDLASYGHPYAETPNLDRLAAEGTRFLQAYAAGATCTPSRTGLMTGRSHATFGQSIQTAGLGNVVTVSALFQQAGYRTGHFGKWNIGPTRTPGTYGFEEIVSRRAAERSKDAAGLRGRDAAVFEGAIDFIERHRDAPFYLHIWARTAHHPVSPPRRYVERFGNVMVDRAAFGPSMQRKFALLDARGADVDLAMRHYIGELFALDEEVGRLLDRLDELDLRENTIVVFSSDQGPARVDPPKRVVGTQAERGNRENERYRVHMLGSAGPLRGGKHTDYEGGVRVPFLLRWPAGGVPAGRVEAGAIISGLDWLPTVTTLAGVAAGGLELDGEDVAAAWRGEAFARTRPLYWRPTETPDDATLREGRWKLHLSGPKKERIELYDLERDPGERVNVAPEHPDVVERLRERALRWAETLPPVPKRS